MNRQQRIDYQAHQAHEQIRQMARAAMLAIEGRINFEIRSLAQQRRWHKFKQLNGGDK
ncbi:MAG: hypothetical protein PHW66_06275 [Gallionella sp.]|nr:hypothetical protein [Gallionella sp.]